ncbi:MAG: polysaccharide biosynthesis tyrosine autokinase [Vicinamibacterales bacterium]
MNESTGTVADESTDPVLDAPVAHVLRVIRRRWKLAVITFVLFTAAGGAAVWVRPQQFEASARLLIERGDQHAVLEDQKNAPEPRADDDILVQSQMLRRRSLVAQSIIKGRLWESPDLGGQAPAEPITEDSVNASGLVDAFLGRLRVETPESRWLLAVSFQSTDPSLAVNAVNLLTQAHVEETRAAGSADSGDTMKWLRDRLEEQRGRLAESEATLQTFVEQRDALSAVQDHQNIVVQKLADLNASLTKAKTERIVKEALYSQLEAARQSPGALDQLTVVLGNPLLQQLRQQIAELSQKELTMAQDLGDRHPELIKVRSELQQAKSRLTAELDRATEAVGNDFRQSQAIETSLTEALDAQKREVLSLNRKTVDYRALERQVVSDRELYQKLLAQTQTRGIVGTNPVRQVRLVEPAVLPKTPVGMDRRAALLLVALGGMLLAVSAPIGVEALDPRIKTPSELTAKLKVPCLAMVPRESSQKGKDPLLTSDPTAFAESFRRMRTTVMLQPHSGPLRLLVTSAVPREGKSLTAINLALVLSETNEPVLLVDGDMRRSRLHTAFDLPRKPGLAELLGGSIAHGEVVHRTRFPNLDVLTGGETQHNTSQLLTDSRLERLEALKDSYRFIVIDSPPVGPVSDACALARHVDYVIFVVGADQSNAALVRQALDAVRDSGAKVLGGVLNGVDLRRSAYYYAPYYSHEYSSYYQVSETTTRQ